MRSSTFGNFEHHADFGMRHAVPRSLPQALSTPQELPASQEPLEEVSSEVELRLLSLAETADRQATGPPLLPAASCPSKNLSHIADARPSHQGVGPGSSKTPAA